MLDLKKLLTHVNAEGRYLKVVVDEGIYYCLNDFKVCQCYFDSIFINL